MDKVIREGAVRVGVDLAKRVIQVHAVDANGRVLTSAMMFMIGVVIFGAGLTHL